VPASYIVNHDYWAVDFDGQRTQVLHTRDNNVGYAGMKVTAPVYDFEGEYSLRSEESTAVPGFAQGYRFPTIILGAGDDNVINLVYIKSIDSREPAELTVNHIYKTTYTVNNVFNRTENDGTLTEVFYSLENDEWVFWQGSEFTAVAIPTFGEKIYTMENEEGSLTIIVSEEENVINISYIRTINSNTGTDTGTGTTRPPAYERPSRPQDREQIPAEVITIDDPLPPLSEKPDLPAEVDEEIIVEIEEPTVPLSEMPQTGIVSTLELCIYALCLSLFGLGVVFLITDGSKKKARKEG